MRDDFSQATKDLLAKRSGYMCAFPDCRQLTVGPSEGRASGLSVIGIAAHIAAAAPGGARYDKSMSSELRASIDNGIWMCQTHAKLIDDNPNKYTVDIIHQWKHAHEEYVFGLLENAKPRAFEGISSLLLSNVGIFKGVHQVDLGRFNIISGCNCTGKSTLCQAISAFDGAVNLSLFAKRFGLDDLVDSRLSVEVKLDAKFFSGRVSVSKQIFYFGSSSKRVFPRLHVEVDGNQAVNWPQSQVRIIYMEHQLDHDGRKNRDLFRRGISGLAGQLRVSEDRIYDILREDFFVTSVFGYRFRRVGRRRCEILVPDGRDFYLRSGLLSGAEIKIALMDVLFKFVEAEIRFQSHIIILDTGFISGFDGRALKSMISVLEKKFKSGLQLLVVVSDDEELKLLKEISAEKWMGGRNMGELVIHSFY